MMAGRTPKRLSWPEFVRIIGDRKAAQRVAGAYHGHGIPRQRKGDAERAERDVHLRKRVDNLLRAGVGTSDAMQQAAKEFGLTVRRVEQITNGG